MFAANTPPASSKDALARLGWQDFEHLLAEHYRAQGYRVEHAAPAPSLKALGSGLDLRLRRGDESLIVRCKHWDTLEVPPQEVNELLSAMLNEASTGGILVTRGRFSAEARNIARRQPRLQLVDGDVLKVMLKLPDHLDVVMPGMANASVAARKAAPARRRAARTEQSRLVPLLLGVVILLLLGLFAWRAISSRPTAVEAPVEATAAPVTPPAHRNTGSAATPPLAVAPAKPEPGIATTSVADSPALARELAERARSHGGASSSSPVTHSSDEAIRVMENNTREVGSSR